MKISLANPKSRSEGSLGVPGAVMNGIDDKNGGAVGRGSFEKVARGGRWWSMRRTCEFENATVPICNP